MKRLLLVRHAKSSWDDPSLPDRDRPLAERGRRDLAEMGGRLAAGGVKPDLVLASQALRARTTAQGLAKMLGCKRKEVVVDEPMYGCGADDLLDVIHALDDPARCVMLVGHNPALSELARRFSGKACDLPTCAVADFSFDVKSWPDVGCATPSQVALDYPRKPR
jgi:phosphohistidine phosphatase